MSFNEQTLATLRRWGVDVDEKIKKNKEENSRSMATLRTLGQKIYGEIDALRKERDEKIKKLHTEGKYTPLYIVDKTKSINTEYAFPLNELYDKFEAEVSAALTEKQTKLDDMLLLPPTQEQLNLLNSLQLRKGFLKIDELRRISIGFMDNYQALNALKAVAAQSDIRMFIPNQYDYDSIVQNMEAIKTYLDERIHDLKQEWRTMSAFGREFFGKEWECSQYAQMADELDGVRSKIPLDFEEKQLTDSEKSAIDNLIGNVEGDELTKRVKELADESDNLKTMLALHPAYKEML